MGEEIEDDDPIEFWHYSFHRKTFRRNPAELVDDVFLSDTWAGTMFQLIKFLKWNDRCVGNIYHQTTTILHATRITLEQLKELE